MNTKLDFVRHEKFGYLTYCPTNIGTGLRASVHVHVPKLTEQQLNDVCNKLDLQVRGNWFKIILKLLFLSLRVFIIRKKGVDGEHSESKGGYYDISNKVRLGKSEFELIHVMW